jgi:hypothetical protein
MHFDIPPSFSVAAYPVIGNRSQSQACPACLWPDPSPFATTILQGCEEMGLEMLMDPDHLQYISTTSPT